MRITLAVLPLTLIAVTLAHPDTQAAAPKAEGIALAVPNGPVLKSTQLTNGLLFGDLKFGGGEQMKTGEVFTANYHCTLKADGRAFDSSYDPAFNHLGPATFSPKLVVDGWSLGMEGMRVGGIRRITVPASLAYGEAGAGPIVPPNADVVLTIELTGLLKIEDIRVGEGEALADRSVAVTTFTMKDEDGNEIDKADAARPYIWLPREYGPINFGLEGMKVGGKRRLTVPADMNVFPENPAFTRPLASPNTQRIPVTIEIELIGARRLLPATVLDDGC